MEILNIENLSFSYPLCTEKAINNISFTVDEGEFLTICAPTGSGKTTLLRLIKKELAPMGTKTGKIEFMGRDIEEAEGIISAKSIGYVMQNPDLQIVTDKVWHELAFGAESIGTPAGIIRRQVAEAAGYFGIEKWFDKKTDELSGGQKQLLNLAAVMVVQPELIILDEPTAQLDPIAATNFLSIVKKLNTELGVTVIIAEHRLENVIPLSDKLMIMNKGSIAYYGDVRDVCSNVNDIDTLNFLPCAVRLHHMLNSSEPCPVSISEGRRFISQSYGNSIKNAENNPRQLSDEKTVELKNICFRYKKEAPDVLNNLSLTVRKNEVLCILGANGSGKSTALSVISGIRKAYTGSLRILGEKINKHKGNELYNNCIAMLPQDVTVTFCKDTVLEELGGQVANDIFPFSLEKLYDKHPFDLSGGEQQLVAFAKILLQNPKILLLDEPTKGIDASTKEIIAQTVLKLKEKGMTVIIVTHDVEFTGRVADTCALFFRGSIICSESTVDFFAVNRFYTTGAARITRGYYDGVFTDEQAIRLCRLNGERTNP